MLQIVSKDLYINKQQNNSVVKFSNYKQNQFSLITVN